MAKGWKRKETGIFALLATAACGTHDGAGSSGEAIGKTTAAIWNGSNDCEPHPTNPGECIDSVPVSAAQRERNGVVRVVILSPTGSTRSSCGGTLLTPQLVLTAGHCVDRYVDGYDLKVIVHHERDSWVRVNAQTPPYMAASTSPVLFFRRGAAPYDDATQDLALVFLDAPQATSAELAAQFPFIPVFTVGGILDFGNPVKLRKEPLVSGEEIVQLIGYGTSMRPDIFTATTPDYRRASVPMTFPFSYSNAAGFPQKALRQVWDPSDYFGADAGDSGGPLFVLNDDGTRSQAAVGIRGCTPNRPLLDSATPLRAPACTPQVCAGGYIDELGNCTAGAPTCELFGAGGVSVPGISTNGVDCLPLVPSLQAYADRLPCAIFEPFGTVLPGFQSPTTPGVCDYVDPLQQCDANGNIVIGDICQSTGPNSMTTTYVEVTSADARDWILTNGADPNSPGRLFGERDYSGDCRPGVDADCDRNLDALQYGCPAVFDAGGGFDPELLGGSVQPVIYGRQSVNIRDRAIVDIGRAGYGDIVAGAALGNSSVTVGNDAKVGNIHGGDIFGIGWRAIVGSVHARSCEDDECVVSASGTSPPVTVGARVPDLRTTPSFPERNGFPNSSSNGGDYDAENLYTSNGVLICNTASTCNINTGAGTVFMAANKYWKDIRLSSGTALRLTAGKHYFDSLTLYSGSKLIVDHRQGAVEIYVRNTLFWQGRVEVDRNDRTGRSGANLLFYYGTASAKLYSTFTGTVLAPNASLELYDTQNQYSGRFFAKSVTLEAGVRVTRQFCEQ